MTPDDAAQGNGMADGQDPLDIRPARAEDVAAIRAVAQAAFAPYLAAIGRAPAPMVADFAAQVAAGLVTVAGLPVAGYIVAWPRDGVLYVDNLAVRPEAQGTGLGARLLNHAEAMARVRGLEAVELYTNAAMSAALRFYPARGYVETDRRREAGFERVYFRHRVARMGDDA
jgi:ribosomal protein S18 acetylase RimI-like enzyme